MTKVKRPHCKPLLSSSDAVVKPLSVSKYEAPANQVKNKRKTIPLASAKSVAVGNPRPVRK